MLSPPSQSGLGKNAPRRIAKLTPNPDCEGGDMRQATRGSVAALARLVLAACLAVSTVGATDLRLIDAVKRRDPKGFDKLLAQGADINASAPDGATALAWAAFLDLPDMAGKLIAAGAKVNTSGDYGE